METVVSRLPLSEKNSGIPQRASRLLPPKAIVKRPHDEVDESIDKENESQGKKAKVASVADTSTSIVSCTSTSAKAKTALAAKTSKPKVGIPAAATKPLKPPMAKSVLLPSTKPGVRGASESGVKNVARKGAQKDTVEDKAQMLEKELASCKQRCCELSREAETLKLSDAQHQNMIKNLEETWEKELSSYRQQCSDLLCETEALKFSASQNQKFIKSLEDAKVIATLQIKNLEGDLACSKQKVAELVHETEGLKMTNDALKRLNDQTSEALAGSQNEVAALKSVVSQMTEAAAVLHAQLEATKMALDKMTADSADKAGQICTLKEELRVAMEKIELCEGVIRENESTRRKLHNTILELKGNIRVFCRVRPLLNAEQSASVEGGLKLEYPDQSTDSRKLVLSYPPSEPSLSGKTKGCVSYDFEFDKVFGPPCSQGKVFEDISQLVQSALDGYNVCIFAYGQTGSGKTFTMEGPEDGDDSQRGMIARTVEQVFACSSQLVDKGWQYQLEASFLEIYNETLRDLLAPAASNQDTKLEIRMDPAKSNEVYVTSLTTVAVTSESQVADLLRKAAKARAVAATLCNERSSRSHSVFRLRISGQNSKTGEDCEATLNLIDLAGSERLANSGSDGDRLKETKSINKSLSNLGNVIMALANKEQHIPYRNSKLTYLLQNCLGGNSKTLMFVNISPNMSSVQETLCSLRFATKVNQCQIGTAKKVTKLL